MDLEGHCRHCKNLYGYEFRDVNIWIDDPVHICGPGHHKYRHHPTETVEKVKEIFWNKVPKNKRKYLEDAVLDHLRKDNLLKDEVKRKIKHIDTDSLKLKSDIYEELDEFKLEQINETIKFLSKNTDGYKKVISTLSVCMNLVSKRLVSHRFKISSHPSKEEIKNQATKFMQTWQINVKKNINKYAKNFMIGSRKAGKKGGVTLITCLNDLSTYRKELYKMRDSIDESISFVDEKIKYVEDN